MSDDNIYYAIRYIAANSKYKGFYIAFDTWGRHKTPTIIHAALKKTKAELEPLLWDHNSKRLSPDKYEFVKVMVAVESTPEE